MNLVGNQCLPTFLPNIMPHITSPHITFRYIRPLLSDGQEMSCHHDRFHRLPVLRSRIQQLHPMTTMTKSRQNQIITQKMLKLRRVLLPAQPVECESCSLLHFPQVNQINSRFRSDHFWLFTSPKIQRTLWASIKTLWKTMYNVIMIELTIDRPSTGARISVCLVTKSSNPRSQVWTMYLLSRWKGLAQQYSFSPYSVVYLDT